MNFANYQKKKSNTLIPYLKDRVLLIVVVSVFPMIVFEALHGEVKLPVAVQVKPNQSCDNVTVLVVDTMTPLLSVHL